MPEHAKPTNQPKQIPKTVPTDHTVAQNVRITYLCWCIISELHSRFPVEDHRLRLAGYIAHLNYIQLHFYEVGNDHITLQGCLQKRYTQVL